MDPKSFAREIETRIRPAVATPPWTACICASSFTPTSTWAARRLRPHDRRPPSLVKPVTPAARSIGSLADSSELIATRKTFTASQEPSIFPHQLLTYLGL